MTILLMKKVVQKDTEEWNPIYDKILDYLDSRASDSKRKSFWYGVDERRKALEHSISSFFFAGNHIEEMKQYRLYVTDQKILGIVKAGKKREVRVNVFKITC